jgi:diguanylate cyclase (GGDEF)-like protein
MEHEKTASFGIARILMLAMGVTFTLFAVSDYWYYREENSFFISLALRGAALISVIIALFIASSVKRYDRALLLITLTELAVFAVYLINLYNQQTRTPAVTHSMSVLILVLAVFLIPNLWKNCLFAGLVIVTCYLIFCSAFADRIDSPPLPQQGIYLGICLAFCAVFTYIREKSERRHFAREKLLESMTITDWLTGIYNRRRFEHILGLWIKNRRHDPFCLLFFDIDDFKKVNDTFGHKAGDEVLQKIAEIVSSKIRDDDIFARWGGEEFVVLFSKMNIAMGNALAERLRKAVEDNHFGKAGKVTISIGVVQYHRVENNKNNETLENFVTRADDKMYEAKKAGKNRVAVEIVAPEYLL